MSKFGSAHIDFLEFRNHICIEWRKCMHGNELRDRLILVIEDDEDVRLFLLTVFADAGARLIEAADGTTGIEQAKRFKPDLITLDLVLPDQNGIDVFCTLRTSLETSEIPVCIFTGHPEFRKLIYDRPAQPPEGFVAKPVDPDELVSTARRILGLHDRKRDRARTRQR
jgi:DNA-binding response OmpR family regulator